MSGEDQHDVRLDRVALPPPTKRRDHHLRESFVQSTDEVLRMSRPSISFGEHSTDWLRRQCRSLTRQCIWNGPRFRFITEA